MLIPWLGVLWGFRAGGAGMSASRDAGDLRLDALHHRPAPSRRAAQRADLEPEQPVDICVNALLVVAHRERPDALAEGPDLAKQRVRGDVGHINVRLGQDFEINARAGPVHPGVVRTDVGDRIDVVLLAAPDRNGRPDLSGLCVNRLPVVLVPIGHVQRLAVRRDAGAVRVRSEGLAPEFPVGREIQADQRVWRVRREIQPSQ